MASNHFEALDVKVGDVMTVPKKLIEVRHDTTVSQVLALMAKYGITSVPVRAAGDAQTPGDSNECIGIINLMDIVAFCVFSIAEGDEFLRVDLANLEKMDAVAEDIIGLVSAEGQSDWSFKTYAADEPLNEVMYPFCAGVHRVLVSTGEPGAEGMLSQTDIIRYIHTHRDQFPADVFATAVGARSATPVTITAADRALVGFKRMVVHDKSSVGIVDADGKLTGNLSLSDLRGINKDSFGTLGDPVGDFLASRGSVRPLVSLAVGATVGDIIERMVDDKVHRVWLVNPDGTPAGQASMSDILLNFTDLSLPLTLPE